MISYHFIALYQCSSCDRVHGSQTVTTHSLNSSNLTATLWRQVFVKQCTVTLHWSPSGLLIALLSELIQNYLISTFPSSAAAEATVSAGRETQTCSQIYRCSGFIIYLLSQIYSLVDRLERYIVCYTFHIVYVKAEIDS